jgi:hypothetical protein
VIRAVASTVVRARNGYKTIPDINDTRIFKIGLVLQKFISYPQPQVPDMNMEMKSFFQQDFE